MDSLFGSFVMDCLVLLLWMAWLVNFVMDGLVSEFCYGLWCYNMIGVHYCGVAMDCGEFCYCEILLEL